MPCLTVESSGEPVRKLSVRAETLPQYVMAAAIGAGFDPVERFAPPGDPESGRFAGLFFSAGHIRRFTLGFAHGVTIDF
jgi:hypothetical protein